MEPKKIAQILRVAKMHYELNMSQVEIAEKEEISKSTVSRMLQTAKDIGLIEVRIKDSILTYSEVERELISRYPLKRAVILPDMVGNQQVLYQDVCGALINDLPRYLENDAVLGVAWGRNLAVVSRMLPSIKRTNMSVIQLSGGYSKEIYESGALEILKNFTHCVGGTGYQIPAPAMVDSAYIADVIKTDSQIAEILELAERCDTAIFSVGDMKRPSIIYEMGLLSDEEYIDMERRGAVGDCCSHFLNEDGEIFDEKLDSRVIAAPLSTIKKMKNKLLVAVGVQKAAVIKAALKGHLVDSLYIDAHTAEEVVRIS